MTLIGFGVFSEVVLGKQVNYELDERLESFISTVSSQKHNLLDEIREKIGELNL